MGRNQPLKIDTYGISNLPFAMRVSLTANQFHPIKKETKEMSVNSYNGCKVNPNKILEIRKDKNCTDDCIPTIFNSLFNMSTFKECPDYESHFCALEDLFLYNFLQTFQCTKFGVENYFDGTVEVFNGISYAKWTGAVNFSTTGNDEDRSQTLLLMDWWFNSPYVANREEVLVYGADDLFAWLGGAIGLFVGYSIHDLLSHMIDLAFRLISRFTKTNANI